MITRNVEQFPHTKNDEQWDSDGFHDVFPYFPKVSPESYPNVKELKDLLQVLVDCGDRRTWAPIGDNS